MATGETTINGLPLENDNLNGGDYLMFYDTNTYNSYKVSLSELFSSASPLREGLSAGGIVGYQTAGTPYFTVNIGNGLQYSGSTLQTNNIPLANISNISGYSVLGRSASTAGAVEALQASANTVLRSTSATSIGWGQVKGSDIENSTITYGKIQNTAGLSVIGRSASTTGVSGAITGTDGGVLRVSGTTLGFGQIATAGIADTAVTSAKIASSAVTAGKIATGGVSASNQFAVGVVDTTSLATGAVTAGKLATGAVTTEKIGGSQVTEAKIATNAVTGSKIADGAITTAKISASAITTDKISDSAVTWAKLAQDAKNNVREELVYMQLVPLDELITTGKKAVFHLPAHMFGRPIVTCGFGVGTYSSGTIKVSFTNSSGLAGTKFYISATASHAEASPSSPYTLITAWHAYQIWVETAGSNCKGLDFWMVVGN